MSLTHPVQTTDVLRQKKKKTTTNMHLTMIQNTHVNKLTAVKLNDGLDATQLTNITQTIHTFDGR